MEKFPKIQAIHKPEARGFDDGHLIIEEKVDGSQGRITIDENGVILTGSRNVENGFQLLHDNAQEIFKGMKADPTEVIQVFGEYLAKPKQNAIAYERVPNHNFVIFDVIVNGIYLDREEKERFAFNVGLEVVPLLWKGEGKDFTDEIREKLLKTKSFLGHQAGYDRIEGIVIKNYGKLFDERFSDLSGKHMCIKAVNESFQEKNKVENPGQGDKIENLMASMCSETRWKKSIAHANEDGLLVNHMKDMAILAPMIIKDIFEEEKEYIKDELWKIFSGKLKGRAIRGLPEFYMKHLEEINRCKAV